MYGLKSSVSFALSILLISVSMLSAITLIPVSFAATPTASSTSSVEHFGWLGYDGNGTIYMTYAIDTANYGNNYNNAYYFPGPYNITNTSYKQDTTQVYYGGRDGANWVNVTDYNGATLRTGSNITYNGPNGKDIQQFHYYYDGIGHELVVNLPVMVTGVTYTPNQMTDFNNQINYTVYWSNLSARFSGIPHLGSTELDAELTGAGGLNVTDLDYKTDYLSNSTLGDLGTTSAITFGIMAVAFVAFPEVSVPLALIAIASDAGTLATTHVKFVNKTLIIPNEPQSTSYLPDYANWTVTNQTYSLLNQTANFEGTTFNMENINNSWSVGTIYDFQIDKSDFGKKGYLTICDNNTLGFYNNPDALPEMGGTVGASPELKIPIAPANVIYGTAYIGGHKAKNQTVMIMAENNGTEYYVRTGGNGGYRFFAQPGVNYTVQFPNLPSTGINVSIGSKDYNETGPKNIFINYSLTFTTGISGGLYGNTWSVTLSGAGATQTISTKNSSLTFSVINETYTYTVNSPDGWSSTPLSGSVTIGSSSLTVGITFTPTEFSAVKFSESGLPSGTSWTVDLWNSKSTTSTSMSLSVPYGNMSYSIPNVNIKESNGDTYIYSPSPSSGTVFNMNGNANGKSISASFTLTGVSGGTGSGCVNASTEILLSNGTYEKASNITNGTAVMTYNVTAHTYSSERIDAVYVSHHSHVYTINGYLKTSMYQPILTDHGYIQAQNLTLNDKLYNAYTGKYIKIWNITEHTGNYTMYDFNIPPDYDFIAWNYVVYDMTIEP